MLKFDKIIRNLTLEEKIGLLVSSKQYENAQIPNYDFPSFKVLNHVEKLDEKLHLPMVIDLASTWNDELIQKCGKEIAKYFIGKKKEIAIEVDINPETSQFGKDPYVSGKFAAAFIRGIESTGLFSCVNKLPKMEGKDLKDFRNNTLLASEIAITEGRPSSIINSDVSNTEILMNEWKFDGLKVCEAATPQELIRCLNTNNEIIIPLTKNYDVNDVIKKAILNYIEKEKELKNNLITKAQFDEMIRSGEILDQNKIDKLLDCLFYDLAHYASSLNAGEIVVDESVLKDVAEESVVLLKNNAILPLDYSTKVALLGEVALESAGKNGSPLIIANDHDVEVSGFAPGYSNDSIVSELKREAIDLALSSDVALVFLKAKQINDKKFGIPTAQIDLINSLHDNKVKVIAVLETNEYELDLSFIDLCDAVLLTGTYSKYNVGAVYDILNGNINPSGHLVRDLTYNDVVLFPVGFGLNYSIFEYKNFEVTRKGITFTVENTSDYSGNDLMLVYVASEGNKKVLRGYSKYYVMAKDYKKININFNNKAFRSFLIDEQCYGIKEGTYKIFVGHSERVIDFASDLEVSGYVDNPHAYNDNLEASGNNIKEIAQNFAETEERNKYYNKKRGTSLKKKLGIGIPLYVYFTIVSAIILLNGLNGKFSVFLIGALLLAATNAIFIVLLVKALKQNKVYKQFNDDEVIIENIEKMKNFHEIYRESFLVKEDTEPFPVKQEKEVKKPTKKAVYRHETKHELVEDNTSFTENVAYDHICPEFLNYALSKGIIIDPASVRMIFSGLSSSRLLFFRSNRKDLLPKFVEILNEYLENVHTIVDINEDIKTEKDLYWTLNAENHYEKSNFVKALYQAKNFKNHINIITLNNVKLETLDDYFDPFLAYCDNFNEKHIVDLGSDDQQDLYEIPNNLFFVIIPEDNEFINSLPKGIAECSFTLDLKLSQNALEVETVEKETTLSYKALTDLIKFEKGIFFLSEDAWKVFDEFEEELANYGKFRIENKVALQLENFTTALFGCGSDEIEVVDIVLATKLIPITKSYKAVKAKENEDVVLNTVLKLFEEENIPNTLKLVKKIETSVETTETE